MEKKAFTNELVIKLMAKMKNVLKGHAAAREDLKATQEKLHVATEREQSAMKERSTVDGICSSSMASPKDRHKARVRRDELDDSFAAIRSERTRWAEEEPIAKQHLDIQGQKVNATERVANEYLARKFAKEECKDLFTALVDFIESWNDDYKRYRMENNLSISNASNPLIYLLPYNFRVLLSRHLNIDNLIHYKEINQERADAWAEECLQRSERAYNEIFGQGGG